jgi:hypothetical protein
LTDSANRVARSATIPAPGIRIMCPVIAAAPQGFGATRNGPTGGGHSRPRDSRSPTERAPDRVMDGSIESGSGTDSGAAPGRRNTEGCEDRTVPRGHGRTNNNRALGAPPDGRGHFGNTPNSCRRSRNGPRLRRDANCPVPAHGEKKNTRDALPRQLAGLFLSGQVWVVNGHRSSAARSGNYSARPTTSSTKAYSSASSSSPE